MASKPKKSFATPRATGRNWTFTFGLVRVPVGLTPLFSESDRVPGVTLCPEHLSPVGQGAHYCKAENHPVAEPIKGYEYEKGSYAILTEEEAAALPLDADESIALKARVDVSDLDIALFEKAYIAWPQDDAAAPAYALLMQNLRATKKALVGEGVFWGSHRVFVVTWNDAHNALLIHTCNYYANIKEQELKIVRQIKLPVPDDTSAGLAEQILGNLPTNYKWEDIRDQVADRQRAVIAEKVATGAVVVPSTPFEAGEIPDLIEQLKASLEVAV